MIIFDNLSERDFHIDETPDLINFENFKRINIDKIFHPEQSFTEMLDVAMVQVYILEKYKICLFVTFNVNTKSGPVTVDDFNIKPTDYKNKLEIVLNKYSSSELSDDKIQLAGIIDPKDLFDKVSKNLCEPVFCSAVRDLIDAGFFK